MCVHIGVDVCVCVCVLGDVSMASWLGERMCVLMFGWFMGWCECVHDYLSAMCVSLHVGLVCVDVSVSVCVCMGCVCVCVGVYQVSVPVLPQARRGDRWSWDPDEERKRQERWQQEQERMLQEKYRREQEKLKEEWERAQREVAEEERKYHEEERKILEETVAPLTPRSSALPSPSRGDHSSISAPQDTIVRSLADWERKQELLERQSRGSTESVEAKRRENDRTSDISTADDSMRTARSSLSQSISQPGTITHSLQNGQKPPAMSAKSSTPVKKQQEPTADNNKPGRPAGDRRSGPIDNNMSRSSSKPPAAHSPTPDTLPPTPNRSVSGKKLCSSCGQPLGKGAAMIIETLSLYFHIHCFKCGVCKGQLGDTTTGTDVRIRNGLLNCHQCYIRSRCEYPHPSHPPPPPPPVVLQSVCTHLFSSSHSLSLYKCFRPSIKEKTD
ncbi:hypothetical protein INR49_026180 [Caranx melampygus]|nr:hypothetical protein INR49_026180 [Caranx melampygus]